jgi:hypothetical protein
MFEAEACDCMLQVEGVKWLWGLFDNNCGGILADDMGLGKVSAPHSHILDWEAVPHPGVLVAWTNDDAVDDAVCRSEIVKSS